MAVYEAFHPDNEAMGPAIKATLSAFDQSDVQHLLNKNGIKELKDDTWYPQQLELNLLRDLYEERSFLDMVAIGMQIPEVAVFPPDINSVHEALAIIDEAYNMNVRGEDIGSYEYHKLGDREAKMVCRNPYPSDFDYGIIYRMVQKFAPDDSSNITVKRDDSIKNRKTGGDTCVYYVSW